MFADDPSVHAVGGDAETLGEQEPESRRVQVGAGADDSVLGQTTHLPGHVGENVAGIADDNQDGVG